MIRNNKSDKNSVKNNKKGEYSHFVPPVNIFENFEEAYKLEHHLIKSYDELLEFYKTKFVPGAKFAWDLETSSLDPTLSIERGDRADGLIAGFSFTQDGHNGYYVPVQHPDISLGYKALKVLYAMISKSKLNLLYNARFDMRFLEHMTPEKYKYVPEPNEKLYAFDLSGINYYDVQCSVWLADTNVVMPSLKWAEKHFLGWTPPTFEETAGNETNFCYLPATQGYRYASIDALGTFHLYHKTLKFYTESAAAGKLDNDLMFPLMRLENTPIFVDHSYLKNLQAEIRQRLSDLQRFLYDEVGTSYNINSNRELVSVFQLKGIDTGQRTATGLMKTDIKTIQTYLLNNPNNEYLNKLIEYKKLSKFDGAYLTKLISMSDPSRVSKYPVRFNYFTCKVPTGRLACGEDKNNPFFSSLNFQSLPKPAPKNYYVHKATEEQIANKEDLLGYVFNDDPEGAIGIAEGQSPKLNARRALRPEQEDCVVISVDMKAEELRLAANVYGEQTWINAFNNDEDVHKATAVRIFGAENYDKNKRKKAKIANFGILYGSSAYGFHRQFPDMSLEECEEFIRQFKSALPQIEISQRNSIRIGRKEGTIKTYLGRPRRVKYYFGHYSRSMRSFAERTCMNTVIQGVAGDLLKLMLLRMWNELFTKYADKGVRWLGTIHDEINVICPKSLLNEVAPIIMRCQTINLPGWPVPILPDFSCGNDFGSLFGFELSYNDDGTVKEFVPQMDLINKEDNLEPIVEDSSYIPDIDESEDSYNYLQ